MSGTRTDAVALLLAAGEGSRLGGDKAFLGVGGMAMVERSLRPYRKAESVSDVIIVVGPGQAERFEPLRSPTRHIVENPDPSRGMISSIRVGLESGWAQERNFLIAPADVPFVAIEIVDQLVRTLRARDCSIVIPTYKGLGGHPGLFHRSVRNDFFLHGDTSGTREILFRHQERTVRLAVHDPDVCFDIDTPEDLEMAMDGGRRWARVESDAEARRKRYLT